MCRNWSFIPPWQSLFSPSCGMMSTEYSSDAGISLFFIHVPSSSTFLCSYINTGHWQLFSYPSEMIINIYDFDINHCSHLLRRNVRNHQKKYLAGGSFTMQKQTHTGPRIIYYLSRQREVNNNLI
jgi:hypothetical protein